MLGVIARFYVWFSFILICLFVFEVLCMECVAIPGIASSCIRHVGGVWHKNFREGDVGKRQVALK